ncbi:MAG: MATE family efflux transporter [Candidatus Methanogranum gryphiswaldense]|nr:MAG: MATE family efflux transporter [Candidatus Methanogranum sp. U3.2.1]
MEATETKEVNMMLGDPKKAIKYLSIPIAVTLLVQQSSSIINILWVTGLGSGPMAALGLVGPIYSVILGLGNGMAIGASAAIARNIGMHRKENAERLAMQAILLVIIIALIMTPLLLLTAEPVLRLIGAAGTIEDSMAYAVPIYLCSIVLMMSCMMSGILRGEGAAKRSMYIQVLAAVINMILDPILIYGFGMGVSGAAWATVIAFSISIIVGIYWFIAQKGTYLTMRLKDLKFSAIRMHEILVVGIPQSAELCLMSLFNIVYNLCIIAVASSGVMAIYTSVWRIMYLALIPAQAVGGAMVSACSAEFGMKRYDMIKQAFDFSTKFSLMILTILAIIVIIFAEPIASLFTYASDMQAFHGEMVNLTRILFISLPIMGMIFVGSSVLQAIGRSIVSMWSSFIRNVLLTVAFVSVTFLIGTLTGLWLVLTVVEILGGALMWYLARTAIKSLEPRDRPAVTISQ